MAQGTLNVRNFQILPQLTYFQFPYRIFSPAALYIAQACLCKTEIASNLRFFYRGADKYLARPTSLCILFDGENISFDASLVIYINSANIPPIMIKNRAYEHQNLLSL